MGPRLGGPEDEGPGVEVVPPVTRGLQRTDGWRRIAIDNIGYEDALVGWGSSLGDRFRGTGDSWTKVWAVWEFRLV